MNGKYMKKHTKEEKNFAQQTLKKHIDLLKKRDAAEMNKVFNLFLDLALVNDIPPFKMVIAMANYIVLVLNSDKIPSSHASNVVAVKKLVLHTLKVGLQ